MTATSAAGRPPQSSPNAVTAPQPSIGNEMHQNTTLRTQNTFIVRGYIDGEWRQMRVKAPDADSARYIAHQRGIRIAECTQIETKI